MKAYKLSLYSFLHFLVDLICCYVVISVVFKYVNPLFNSILITISYNFVAFALQAPMGLIVDYKNNTKMFQLLSIILLMLGLYLSQENNMMFISVIVVGLGNSLFHVSFAADLLNENIKKSKYLGIFISTGALGVSLGTFFGINQLDLYAILQLSLLICLLLLSYFYKYNTINQTYYNLDINVIEKNKSVLLLLILVVVLRAYMGGKISINLGLDEVMEPILIIVLTTLPLVLGKAFGGILADKFGFKNTIIYTLAISIFFSIVYYITGNMLCAIVTVFTFNMTMPLTLYQMQSIISGSKSFAFGLLSFSLFLGYVLSLYVSFSFEYIIVSIITLISLYYTTDKIGIDYV